MPLFKDSIIGNPVTLKRLIIAKRTGNGTYAANETVFSMVSANLSASNVTASREGNGSRNATVSRMVRGTLEIEFAAPQFRAFVTLMDQIMSESGTSAAGNRQQKIDFLVQNMPAVGIAGSAEDDEGNDNAFHFFVPRAIITAESLQLFSLSGGETPVFGTTTVSFDCLADEAYVKNRATEVQNLSLGGATGGSFTLTFGDSETTSLAHNVTAADIQTALQALNSIGTGNVTVADGASSTFNITFAGTLVNLPLPLIVLDATSLTGATSPAVTRTTAGNLGDDLVFTLYANEENVAITIPPIL